LAIEAGTPSAEPAFEAPASRATSAVAAAGSFFFSGSASPVVAAAGSFFAVATTLEAGLGLAAGGRFTASTRESSIACFERLSRSARSSRISFSRPSSRKMRSMPLCARRSVDMRRSRETHMPTVRIIWGSFFGPTTTIPTTMRMVISPALMPNTRLR
jgi:hypothetical protein